MFFSLLFTSFLAHRTLLPAKIAGKSRDHRLVTRPRSHIKLSTDACTPVPCTAYCEAIKLFSVLGSRISVLSLLRQANIEVQSLISEWIQRPMVHFSRRSKRFGHSMSDCKKWAYLINYCCTFVSRLQKPFSSDKKSVLQNYSQYFFSAQQV